MGHASLASRRPSSIFRGRQPCLRPAGVAPRLFTDRAISYRQLNGFDHLEVTRIETSLA
jgi:hypothetical protein